MYILSPAKPFIMLQASVVVLISQKMDIVRKRFGFLG